MTRPTRTRFLFRCLAWLLLASAGAASATTFDAETRDRGAELAYRRAVTTATAERRANMDSAAIARVRRIGNRLVAASVAMAPQTRNYGWAFNLVAEPDADVRVYPGGRVLVSDSLVTKTGFNDDELAAVLAHAIAHVVLGHHETRLTAALATRDVSADPNRQALDVAEATADTLAKLRYQPAEIDAADRAAVELMWRAIFDPRAATSAWRRLALGQRGIVARSPAGAERIASLDASVRTAVPVYEEARAKAEALAQKEEERRRRAFISGQRERGGPPFTDAGPPKR